MKAVMLSIQPKWCEKIASGEKTVEVRKTRPKIETPFKCYIYATKPKKYYRVSKSLAATDENLYLAKGKVQMCDGFQFWAEGTEYERLNGKVIGEFVCDKIEDFHCASVPYVVNNNLGYGEFIDNGVYKVQGNHEGIVFEKNDKYIDTMIKNAELANMCLSAQELFDYIGLGNHLYAWHISDLVIYDKPKDLDWFRKPMECHRGKQRENCVGCWDCEIKRPPQSWCYVEVKE